VKEFYFLGGMFYVLFLNGVLCPEATRGIQYNIKHVPSLRLDDFSSMKRGGDGMGGLPGRLRCLESNSH
jgi:hypothetical protein